MISLIRLYKEPPSSPTMTPDRDGWGFSTSMFILINSATVTSVIDCIPFADRRSVSPVVEVMYMPNTSARMLSHAPLPVSAWRGTR